MTAARWTTSSQDDLFLQKGDFCRLLDILRDEGYTLVGPTPCNGAITVGEFSSAGDLPAGWTEEQEPGRFSMIRTGSPLLFGFGSTIDSWKRFLFPPEQVLFRADRDACGFTVHPPSHAARRYAFVGVRSCDLAAMGFMDEVFLNGPYRDPVYAGVRKGMLILALDCTRPGGTCFCASMDTGPRAVSGFDIALTEVLDGTLQYFLARFGTRRGKTILDRLQARPASDLEREAAATLLDRAVKSMGRTLDVSGLDRIVREGLDHGIWDRISRRCLSCGNCTCVCPTCFCSTVEEANAVDGSSARRTRRWDSCFSMEFSHIHGGSVRSTPRAWYRQWLTHKLSTAVLQFGRAGCVGCGRCITGCPAGIDITAVAREILGQPDTMKGE